MVDNHVEEEIDLTLFLKHFYKNRGLIFRVLIIAIGVSLIYSILTYMLNPPLYSYTSQSVIDVAVSEDSVYQKEIFISYLESQIIFDDSAKSISLEAEYDLWRNSIVIENIKDSSQIVFKISASSTDKLVELNRRMVSNAIFQTRTILTGLSIRTVEEAELLDDIKELRESVSFINHLFIFVILGMMSTLGWLTFQVITNSYIGSPKDIEYHTDLTIIGTIPDFTNLNVTEELNIKNFMRGLIWKKKK